MGNHDSSQPGPSRWQAWQMFDRIAPRYDLLNRLLSFGRDTAWRRALVRCLPDGSELYALDLATGTGDVLITLHRESGRLRGGLGADMSGGMLIQGRKKLIRLGLWDRYPLARCDATRLGLRENVFDVVTIAFGIRNVVAVETALEEMRRVLRPGGRVLILEFSLPENRLFRRVYLWYFRHVLPRIGGIISGDTPAYRYLNETVESFPYGEAFCALMKNAGFENIQSRALTLGIAAIYQGDKARG